MSDIEVTADNDTGFSATSTIDGVDLRTHAQGETAPSTNEVLVATYAQCYAYALRATAMRGDYEDPGAIHVDGSADLDEDDDLAAIRLTFTVDTDYDDATVDSLVAGANDLCHVHAALADHLHADVTVTS